MPPDPDATPDPELETTPDPEPEGRAPAGAALRSALEKERKNRKELEKQLKALADREREREDAEKSEVERLKAKISALESDAEKHEHDSEQRTRAETVRRAAKEFADPEDAIAILRSRGDLEDIESDDDAERAIKRLAKEKPHLLKPKEAPSLDPLDRVLHGGLPEGERESADNDPLLRHAVIPADKLNEMSDEEVTALKQRDPALFRRSAEALFGAETFHTVG